MIAVCSRSPLCVGVVDANADTPAASGLEAETIEPFTAMNGETWKTLRGQCLRGSDGFSIRRQQQVVVALAKGVADFGKHGNESAGALVAIPEADRIKDVAEHARKGLQDDIPVGHDPRASRPRIHGSNGVPSRGPWSTT